MYNTLETLSSKCRKYHLKKATKKVFLALFILFASVFIYNSYIFYNSVQNKQEILSNEDTQKTQAIKEETPKVQEQNTVQKKRVNKDVKYDLSMDEYTYTPSSKTSQKQTSYKITNKETSNKPFSISTRDIDSIKSLLDAYKSHKTYSLAIKISKQYYENQNYDESLSWSRKANKLDKKDDQSWIMYAKSEYALGNRHTAKNMLSLYLKNASSKEAQRLLQNWLKGD